MLKAIQTILKTHKLYTGNIDGQIGLGTLRAIDSMSKAAMEVQTKLKEAKLYTGNIEGAFGLGSYEAFNSLIPAPVITAEALKKIYPSVSSKFLQHINSMAAGWGIKTKSEMCLFLANTLVESFGFNDKDMRENFNYKSENLQKTFSKYIATIEGAKTLIAKDQ